MPRLNVLIERGEMCHSLRSKTMFYQSVVDDPTNSEHSPDGPFWCAETQSLIGPDGKIADAEACQPGSGRCCCGTV